MKRMFGAKRKKSDDTKAAHLIKNNAKPVSGNPSDYDHLLEAVGDSQVVMIGEASHGTHEFYHIRAEITKRLIQEKGFNMVTVEGDWPDVYRANRYVCSQGKDNSAEESLRNFTRFPRWMWRNTVVRDFVDWMKTHNDTLEFKEKARFYGLDLYSLFTSADEVIKYLDKVDPKAAGSAREKYGTLDTYRGDEFQYARDVAFGFEPSREKEVVDMLVHLLKKGSDYIKANGGFLNGDELFYTIQNARVVKDAEEYYRMAFRGGTVTWNLRDKHMVDTLQELLKFHKDKIGQERPKAVIWAHNSHLGDSRAFERNKMTGKWNVGQLVRERYGLDNSFNIGFTTFGGSVMASESWGAEGRKWELNTADNDSYEYLFHNAVPSNYSLLMRSNSEAIKPEQDLVSALMPERVERLIGVMYVKYRERSAHYQEVVMPQQFDSVIHYDITSALQPLDQKSKTSE